MDTKDQTGGGMDGPIHSLSRDGATIAYRHTPGSGPTIVFLGGFRSDMTGTKAVALERWAQAHGRSYIRFDYQGHGASSGVWEDCTIGLWLGDALAVLDQVAKGPVVLVGSSMGGWVASLVAKARPEQVKSLVTVAAAPDFTERLIWQRLSAEAQGRLPLEGSFLRPSAYDPAGYRITWKLVQEGRDHLVLGKPLPFTGPARLLHGLRDTDVPWGLSLELAETLSGEDVRLTLVKDGDHRLSRDQDIALLLETVRAVAS